MKMCIDENETFESILWHGRVEIRSLGVLFQETRAVGASKPKALISSLLSRSRL